VRFLAGTGQKQRPVLGFDTEEPGFNFSGDGDHDALDCKTHHIIWRNQAFTNPSRGRM